jgi:hypothetical protein
VASGHSEHLTPCPPSREEAGTHRRRTGIPATFGAVTNAESESPLLAGGGQGVGPLRYRFAQGIRALIPALAPLDVAMREDALTLLPENAATAFRALPRSDQSHALRVHIALRARGETDADLLAAALLHDFGKQPGIGVTQKTVRVLLARWPRLLQWIGRDRAPLRRWRRGMARLLDHATIGADIAEQWGCSAATVAIIRASHEANQPEIVRRLQAVDDLA